MTASARKPWLLIVDDNPADIELFREVMEQVDRSIQLRDVDGAAPLFHLLDHAQRSNNLPFLLILDLNMPEVDGVEILQQIRSDIRFEDLSIIVFSTSSSAFDRERVRAAGPATYVSKPRNLAGMRSFVSDIADAASHGWPSRPAVMGGVQS